jgi:hypothetical protein
MSLRHPEEAHARDRKLTHATRTGCDRARLTPEARAVLQELASVPID